MAIMKSENSLGNKKNMIANVWYYNLFIPRAWIIMSELPV